MVQINCIELGELHQNALRLDCTHGTLSRRRTSTRTELRRLAPRLHTPCNVLKGARRIFSSRLARSSLRLLSNFAFALYSYWAKNERE